MRLVCNGEVLDMKSGTSISFQKVNPLFAFDNIKCERTQAFDVPDTPKNERVFGLAKIAAYRGEGMRRRFACEMQDGVVVKRGYLYVDKYAKGAYSCVFVTGELVGLQRIKEAGKVADLVNQDERMTFSGVGKDAREAHATWDEVKYMNEREAVYPSWSLKGVIDECAQRLGVHIATDRLDGVRVVPNELQGTKGREVRLTSERVEGEPMNVVAEHVFDGMLTATATTIRAYHTEAVPDYGGYYEEIWVDDEEYRLQVYRAEQDLVLTFPEDMPSGWHVLGIGNPTYWIGGDVAGKTIRVRAGQGFLLVKDGDKVVERTGGPYPEREGGEFYTERVTYPWGGSDLTFDFDVRVESASEKEVQVGQTVWMRDNLPDMTLTDLLKVAAALTGTALNYTDADGVTFDALAFDEWAMIGEPFGKVVAENELTRRFGDYAQRNVIRFEGWDSTRESERLSVAYYVDNDNLESENVLQEMKLSEGGVAYDDEGTAVVFVRDGEQGGGNVQTICKAGAESEWMQRVTLPKNGNLQRLCDESTSVVLSVRMPLWIFERIGARVVALVRGTRYVWTEAKWAKDVAEFTLSKVR